MNLASWVVELRSLLDLVASPKQSKELGVPLAVWVDAFGAGFQGLWLFERDTETLGSHGRGPLLYHSIPTNKSQ